MPKLSKLSQRFPQSSQGHPCKRCGEVMRLSQNYRRNALNTVSERFVEEMVHCDLSLRTET